MFFISTKQHFADLYINTQDELKRKNYGNYQLGGQLSIMLSLIQNGLLIATFPSDILKKILFRAIHPLPSHTDWQNSFSQK
ncbi:MAG: hypothetical protein WBK40_01810, partial [Bacteroidales bacterium]